MYSRGLVIPARWGYEIISMVTWVRLGIDILLSEIHAWLADAAELLKSELETGYIVRYPGEGYMMRCGTMEEHWEAWTHKMLELSKEGSVMIDGCELCNEVRQLAGKCYESMR